MKQFLLGKGKVTDNSICGHCSKCGECCTCFLPITQEELNQIQFYVLRNNIKPQKQMLIMQNRLTCPYYDSKKCLIYEVRPIICKEFYCYKKPSLESLQRYGQNLDKYKTVNMWDFAEFVEKQRKEKEVEKDENESK